MRCLSNGSQKGAILSMGAYGVTSAPLLLRLEGEPQYHVDDQRPRDVWQWRVMERARVVLAS